MTKENIVTIVRLVKLLHQASQVETFASEVEYRSHLTRG